MQQSFRFYDIDPEQLSFDFPLPEVKLSSSSLWTIVGDFTLAPDGNWGNTTLSSYLTISNSDGEESTRVDDVGIHLRVPKKTWLKTKLANYLGINYL